MKRWYSFVLASLGWVGVGDLRAQPAAPPNQERCLAAYEQGQRLRMKHSLIAARAELLLCARAPCPESFRPECLQWFDQVQHLVPSVIVRVEDDMTNVRVSIDGVLVATRLDGTPIEVDPGEHVFRFEPKDRAASEQRVVINEGEKARVLTVSVTAPTLRPEPRAGEGASKHGSSKLPWVFVGVSGISLGSFAYFGATGLSRRHTLDQCTPYCQQDDIDNTRRRFIAADVSLAVSALSLGIAIYGWLSAGPSNAAIGTAALQLEATGGPNSAFIGASRAF